MDADPKAEFKKKLVRFGLDKDLKDLKDVNYTNLNKEIDRLSSLKNDPDYFVIKYVLFQFLRMYLACMAVQLEDDCIKFWKKDQSFSKLWEFIDFDMIISSSKYFKKINGDMMPAKYAQKGVISKDDKHIYTIKILKLRTMYPDKRYAYDLENLTSEQLKMVYEELFDRILYDKIYVPFSELIITNLCTGVDILNNSHLSPFSVETRNKLKMILNLKYYGNLFRQN